MSIRLTDLLLEIEDIPEDAATEAWNRLNIIAEAFTADGWHVTVNRSTYAPKEDAE